MELQTSIFLNENPPKFSENVDAADSKFERADFVLFNFVF